MAKSTSKPAKPHKDFPLFAHATKRWAKKVRGKTHYFGPWSDAEGALQKWIDQKDDLLAGRVPRAKGDGATVRDLVNRFLTAKRHLVDNSELSPRTFADYHKSCDRIQSAFGLSRIVDDLANDDFEHLRRELSKTRGPVALGNEINRIRVVFKYAYDSGLIDRPVRYGAGFKRPSKRVMRRARASGGLKMFEAAELRAMIDAAGYPLKAMFLLAINAGFGNSDCATLPRSAIDLQAAWIDYPRPKTAVPRRCPLWPETVEAIRESLARRPANKDPEAGHLVFVTKQGLSWSKDTQDNPISKETSKIMATVGTRRKQRSFYAIRHTFRTVADEVRDQPSANLIMGHDDGTMAGVYREKITDDRLRAVVDHVRNWLFGGLKCG